MVSPCVGLFDFESIFFLKKPPPPPPQKIFDCFFFWVVVPLQLVDDVIRILHRLSVCLSVRRMTIERRDDVMAVIDLILSNHSSNTHTHTHTYRIPVIVVCRLCFVLKGSAKPPVSQQQLPNFPPPPPLKFLHFFVLLFSFNNKIRKEKRWRLDVSITTSIATLFYFFFFIISSSYLLWSRIC